VKCRSAHIKFQHLKLHMQPLLWNYTHRRRQTQPMQTMVIQMTEAATAMITMTTNAKNRKKTQHMINN